MKIFFHLIAVSVMLASGSAAAQSKEARRVQDSARRAQDSAFLAWLEQMHAKPTSADSARDSVEAKLRDDSISVRVERYRAGQRLRALAQPILDSASRVEAFTRDSLWRARVATFHRPKRIETALLNYYIVVGMTDREVVMVWRPPASKNVTITSSGAHEQWVYELDRYVYLDNGIVTAIQLSRK
jgi:hypothetical protein